MILSHGMSLYKRQNMPATNKEMQYVYRITVQYIAVAMQP